MLIKTRKDDLWRPNTSKLYLPDGSWITIPAGGAGTTNTTRVTGIPSGYPSEIDADLKVRFVDEDVINVSDYNNLKVLKLFGFDSPFEFDNPKVEWVQDDIWKRRGTIDNNPLLVGDTTLSINGSHAHRYPRGTILQLGTSNDARELVYVSAQVDADDLTIVRAYAGTTAAQWATGTEFMVAGFAENEGTTWTLRQTDIKDTAFNFSTMTKGSVRVSWRRLGQRLYGQGTGQDLAEKMDKTIKQEMAMFEHQVLVGQRDPGVGTNEPATMGGLDFYVTAANGAQVTDLAGAAVTFKDIIDIQQNIAYEVGEAMIPSVLLTDMWGARKISGFFENQVRLDGDVRQGEKSAGIAVTRITSVFGTLDVIHHTSVPKGTMYLIRPDQIRVGVMKGFGRLHIGESNNTNTGDFSEMFWYGDYSLRVKNPSTMGIIKNYSLSS